MLSWKPHPAHGTKHIVNSFDATIDAFPVGSINESFEHMRRVHVNLNDSFDALGQRKSVKYLTCWYWLHGGCNKPEVTCLYSHYDTGMYANKPRPLMPGGPIVAGRNAYKMVAQPVATSDSSNGRSEGVQRSISSSSTTNLISTTPQVITHGTQDAVCSILDVPRSQIQQASDSKPPTTTCLGRAKSITERSVTNVKSFAGSMAVISKAFPNSLFYTNYDIMIGSPGESTRDRLPEGMQLLGFDLLVKMFHSATDNVVDGTPDSIASHTCESVRASAEMDSFECAASISSLTSGDSCSFLDPSRVGIAWEASRDAASGVAEGEDLHVEEGEEVLSH